MKNNMIKIVVLILLMTLLFPSCSEATTLSHRYRIPETEYSVELPWFFYTLSKEMNECEPVIFEWGVTLDEALSRITESPYSMFAASSSPAEMYMYVKVTEFDTPMAVTTKNLSDYQLSEYAEDHAKIFYGSNENYIPLNEEKLGTGYEADHTRFISFEYTDSQDSTYQAQHYVIVEEYYMINIAFYYHAESEETLKDSKFVAKDILDSVQSGYFLYDLYE